jgi:large repetitive protein
MFSVTGNTNAGLFATPPAVASNGTLTFMTAPDAIGSATITLIAQDNGGTAIGGDDTSGPQNFTITVNPVNDAPSFTKGADQTVFENAGPQTVPAWATAMNAGPADEAGQTFTFTVTANTNPSLFSAGPAVAPDGTLTFTPATNANGTATITLTVSDSGGTANGGIDTSTAQTFVIDITSVNSAPSFTKGADQTIAEDAGLQTIGGWATAISAGPADEAGQVLTFNVTNNTNAALFAAGPAVAADGTLTYTTAPNAIGSATITLTLSDDGGTANGGVDTSSRERRAELLAERR